MRPLGDKRGRESLIHPLMRDGCGGLRLLHDADDVRGVGEVPVVQKKGGAGLVRIMDQVIDTGSIEGGTPWTR
jgi:hypothetical protein